MARIELTHARRRIATLWLIASATLLALLILQSLGNKYGSEVQRAWGWLLPTVLPTLSLILGSIAYQARHGTPDNQVDRFAFQCAFYMSAFYLFVVFATVVLQNAATGHTPLGWLELSNLWLGPLQGLTAVAVAVFFQAPLASPSTVEAGTAAAARDAPAVAPALDRDSA